MRGQDESNASLYIYDWLDFPVVTRFNLRVRLANLEKKLSNGLSFPRACAFIIGG